LVEFYVGVTGPLLFGGALHAPKFLQLSRQTRRRDWDSAVNLCGLQDGEYSGGTTKMEQTAATDGDMLVMADAEAKKGAALVVSSAGTLGRTECLNRLRKFGSVLRSGMIPCCGMLVRKGCWERTSRLGRSHSLTQT
jgi:hypothetical protein